MFDPASVTFTFENWDQSQTITTTAIDDDTYEGVHYDTISFTTVSDDSNYNNFLLTDVPVTILDDDPEPNVRSSSGSFSMYTETSAPKNQQSKAYENFTEDVQDSDTCPITQTLTQNLQQGAVDGEFNTFTGATATEVALLQQYINEILADSYESPAGPRDGIFGRLTKRGVERMQQALLERYGQDLGVYGIDGIVGPFTRAAINGWCKRVL